MTESNEKITVREYYTSIVRGTGVTADAAKIKFFDEFEKWFPKERGRYSVVIRAPLEYSSEKDYMTGVAYHCYRMRIYYLLEESYPEAEHNILTGFGNEKG